LEKVRWVIEATFAWCTASARTRIRYEAAGAPPRLPQARLAPVIVPNAVP